MDMIVLALVLVLVIMGIYVIKLNSEIKMMKIRNRRNSPPEQATPTIEENVNERLAPLSLEDVELDGEELYYNKITASEIETIFRSMLANSKTISFCAIDNSLKYLVFNHSYKTILKKYNVDVNAGDYLNQTLDSFENTIINPSIVENFLINVKRALTGERVIYDDKIIISGEETVYQCVEMIPLIKRDNTIIGAAITIRDTTREQMRQRMLEQTTLEEKNANQAKTNFLANMSHEIRTPMNGILGLTDLLLESELNEEQYYFLTMIRKSGLSLLNIINDILDFSKIESGNFSIVENDVNFYHLIDEVKEFFHFKSNVSNIEFKCVIDPNVPMWLVLDSLRIRQILINLIGNAFKYTTEGYVKVIVRMIKKEAETEYLKISVEDSGTGISYSRLASIFDRFQQAENNYNRSYDGTGLGLAICKQLITAMNGTIDVISKKDVGSIFYFEVPLIKGRKTQTYDFEKRLKVNFSKDIHILIVEDNQVNGLLATSLMNKIGVSSSLARNGLEAVKVVGEQDFDLIFMDISMPVMDGLEAFKIIREELRKTMPIVALTAHSMVEDRQRILAAGMTDYLSKPFSEADVSTMIERYVINPAKIVHRVSQLNDVPKEKNKRLSIYGEPISGEVLNTPLGKMNSDEKNMIADQTDSGYNEHDLADKLSRELREELLSESLEGIRHVDYMLEGDHDTTFELVQKLIELLSNDVLEQLRMEMVTGNTKEVSEGVHYIKGAVSNFRFKHLLDELSKIKFLDWTDYKQIDGSIEAIKALRVVLVVAFEQFKSQCQVNKRLD